MNKIFVKTTNVKNFIGLVKNLINKPKLINKMETFAKDNNLAEINMEVINQII